MPLECNACEGSRPAVWLIICRRHSDDHGAVTVCAVPPAVAHAVYCRSPRLRGSVDHITAGAHTEGIDTPAGSSLRGYLVRSRRKGNTAFSVLQSVNHLPRVFHAQSHRKCLCFHRHLQFMKHLKGVPRAVTDRQNDRSASKILPVYRYTHDLAVFPESSRRQKSRHLRLKTYLAAPFHNLPAQILYHMEQNIRADMRFGVI